MIKKLMINAVNRGMLTAVSSALTMALVREYFQLSSYRP